MVCEKVLVHICCLLTTIPKGQNDLASLSTPCKMDGMWIRQHSQGDTSKKKKENTQVKI
jgi:hypothetical protein